MTDNSPNSMRQICWGDESPNILYKYKYVYISYIFTYTYIHNIIETVAVVTLSSSLRYSIRFAFVGILSIT